MKTAGAYRISIVRDLRVEVRRVGPVAFLVCRGCGKASDIEREDEALAVSQIPHANYCQVADLLKMAWRHQGTHDEVPRPSGRTVQRWQRDRRLRLDRHAQAQA